MEGRYGQWYEEKRGRRGREEAEKKGEEGRRVYCNIQLVALLVNMYIEK